MAAPFEAWPVRVCAGAFGNGLPKRDLHLSPGHPVLVGQHIGDGDDETLVPIMCLINGTSIARVPVERVTYWHVELDVHDILLAEGLPAESYIALGSRPWFAGADGILYDPDMALPGMPGRCRRVAIDGPSVEAERCRLDVVFATQLASAAAWPGEQNALLALFYPQGYCRRSIPRISVASGPCSQTGQPQRLGAHIADVADTVSLTAARICDATIALA